MMAASRKTKKPKKDTSFATWKFDLENTVNADPLCDGNCLKLLRPYLDFMGSPKIRPYLSIISLKVATGLHDGAIVKARRTMETVGYFVRDGYASSGAVKYKIVNVRRNLVLDHQTIKRETLKRFEAEKKEKERQKRKDKADRSAAAAGPLSPADFADLNREQVCGFDRDRSAAAAGTYVYNDVEVISRRREDGITYPSDDALSYSTAQSGDEANQPLPVPKDETEADQMIEALCDGFDVIPVIKNRLMSLLMDGVLTPNLASGMLGQRVEAA